MTLEELQETLGTRITAVSNLEQLSSEDQKMELLKSEMISRLAKQMINNADVVLRTDKLVSEGKLSTDSVIYKMVKGNGN